MFAECCIAGSIKRGDAKIVVVDHGDAPILQQSETLWLVIGQVSFAAQIGEQNFARHRDPLSFEGINADVLLIGDCISEDVCGAFE